MKFIIEVTDHRFRVCRIAKDPPDGEYELDTMADSSAMSTYLRCMEDMLALGTGRDFPRPAFVCVPQSEAEKREVRTNLEAAGGGFAIKLDVLLDNFYVVPKVVPKP
jgi:hypothetical protein